MQNQNPTDLTKLRYVLYARKSTEDENRQVRSIDDQIADCKKLATDLGLHIAATVKETKSAKKPGKRDLFTKLLKDIENKKYDAILCWHPDRLCRNMLEGGQIIHMLDEGTLKDIRFHSHQFSNDANGKMLLGMLFVFSKQYSDDLSDKVNRSVRSSFGEGKTVGTPKFGYTRNEQTGLYEPNEHFEAVQTSWQKRANGESLEAVTQYLIDSGVKRVTKPKKKTPSRTILPTINSVSKMFKDSFYYGILVQKSQVIDLRLVPGYTFEPMIDDDTNNLVQALSRGRTKDTALKKRTAFYPLRRFVYCAVCNDTRYMYVGKNKSNDGKYKLSYRCDNPDCTRKPKSLRARNVFNSIYERLESFELTDEAYERYSKRLDGMTDQKVVTIRQDILSRRGALTHLKNELEKRSLGIIDHDKSSAVYQANDKRITELTIQVADYEEEIEKLEAKVANPQQIKLTKAEFLNLRVDNEKVASYLWKEPFSSLVKATELSSGRGERT